MKYNEDSRVKIPALIHLSRLGYEYLSLKDSYWEKDNNVFKEIFISSLLKINKDVSELDIEKHYQKINLLLDNDDLGKEFYSLLLSNEIKLIDFDNISNNTFNVVTELPYINGEDSFRPDITLLINGMPLVFIEVKKPNNKEGIIAERNRINSRFKNRKFKKFINISQILVFTNNMQYEDDGFEKIQGSFYATTSNNDIIFNSFIEEKVEIYGGENLSTLDNAVEDFILLDNNLASIKSSEEYNTSKGFDTPTNMTLSSLFDKERLFFFLRYGIAFVKTNKGYQKHIMRYPQFFATKAIEKMVNKNINKGIIWHTQGSGKTALAYFNVEHLSNLFQKKGVLTKFYFVVDRVDLLKQAMKEFSARGLKVHTVSSRDELYRDFQSNRTTHNFKGENEITIVNIQQFSENTAALNIEEQNSIQRIYFIDEVHRSYKAKGSFLYNLMSSDKNAITIGLTGTPLIKDGESSKEIFGDYIHKYYYNSSIADGYTLRLLREGVETKFKLKMQETIKGLEIEKGGIKKEDLYAHDKYVEPLSNYISDDFIKSRTIFADDSIGGMIICESSLQARNIYEHLLNNKNLKCALILHDEGSKEDRDIAIESFKNGAIDILIVFKMLQTGFDAPRLKKLYLTRIIKSHNLLQTLTRVNRPYKSFRFGYLVDFADIREEFEETNRAYFDELKKELGDESEKYSNIFMTDEEIINEISKIKNTLFSFDTSNKEVFSSQISELDDKEEIIRVRNSLLSAKSLYNIIRLMEKSEFIDTLDFKTLSILLRETQNHLDLINFKKSLEDSSVNSNLLNAALEDILFLFTKVSEEELKIADELKNKLKKTREELGRNIDKSDIEFIELYEELRRLFEQKNLDDVSQEEMEKNIQHLSKIYKKVENLNKKNERLRLKFLGDEKFVRIHKKALSDKIFELKELTLFQSLMEIKNKVDQKLLNNSRLIHNESYFAKMTKPIIISSFEESSVSINLDQLEYIKNQVVNEYFFELEGSLNW